MKRSLRLVAGPILLLALAACHSSTGNGTQDTPMELKAYSVPNERTTEIASALNVNLSSEKAHASMVMPGKVLVYAPSNAQASIGSAIEDLAKSMPTKSGDRLWQLRMWMIEAEPGTGSDDPVLAPLADALKTLQASLGPQHFNLLEVSSATTSENGSLTTADGHMLQFRLHTAARANQSIDLDIDYRDGRSSGAVGIYQLQTTISIQPGQYVVLAQAPARGVATTEQPSPGSVATRLLVVRVDSLNSPN